MSKWSKEDINAWNDSEVFNEFEKLISEAAINLAKQAQQVQQVSQKTKQIKTDVDSASKSLTSFLDKAKSLAEDQESTEEEDQKYAKSELIRELTMLADEAIEEKDYKLAYKIERTIDLIKYE